MDRDSLTLRRAEIIKTVEAIDIVLKSQEWQKLRELIFDKAAERIERLLLTEAKKPKLEVENIYILQGELQATKRYDLATYADKLRRELDGIKRELN